MIACCVSSPKLNSLLIVANNSSSSNKNNNSRVHQMALLRRCGLLGDQRCYHCIESDLWPLLKAQSNMDLECHGQVPRAVCQSSWARVLHRNRFQRREGQVQNGALVKPRWCCLRPAVACFTPTFGQLRRHKIYTSFGSFGLEC